MKQTQKVIIPVHISTIKVGDTIVCQDDCVRTVCAKDIKYNSFLGYTLFGDSYNLGTRLVHKIVHIDKHRTKF